MHKNANLKDTVILTTTLLQHTIERQNASTLQHDLLETSLGISIDHTSPDLLYHRENCPCHKIARSLRVGTVTINNRDGGGIEVPFGGYKQSGFGRDKSLHALDKYSQLKTTYITVG